MDNNLLKKILQDLYNRKIKPDDVVKKISTLPYENLDFAKIDHHRTFRNGIPEVIYGEGKTEHQLISIIKSLYDNGSDVLTTKLKPEVYINIKGNLPMGSIYNESSQTLIIKKLKTQKEIGHITIISAGTSDIPIAEEAKVTAELFGSKVEVIYDVGVAGIHRILDKIIEIRQARVVIVVAGMDGALASVVGGLVKNPVIAVPTSIGYGSSFGGVSALLAMLNSCSTGVATVNIDNGFGAGCIAHKINLLGEHNS
jgi:pyridinium-3,5-biscarboxylic acid mononucleotide synthase